MKKNWEKLFQIMRDDFQLTDLVGFSRLLGVKENDNFEDFMVEILDSYNQQEKKIEIDFQYNKDSLQGEENRVPQVGWIYNEQTNTHWKISPLWPFKFDYLILDLDKDYQWTVIGVPNQKYIWVMARSPVMSDESLKRILSATENAGYNIQNVKRISHKN